MTSERVNKIHISQTMRISAEAKKLSAEGKEIIDLSSGEPDFPTPPEIKDAATDSIARNFTKYTNNAGIPELREAIVKKLKNENGINYKAEHIIVSNGAKQCIYNSVQAIVNNGDEVIIPAPYWVSYPEMVTLAQGKTVIIDTDERNGFKITQAQLKAAVTSKTKAFILCNPSNPTGSVYTRSELEELASVCREYDFYIISDEIYEKIIYDNLEFTAFSSLKSMKERTVLINGVSKAYAMTGWRIGYAAGPEDIIKGMEKIQSHSTSNASSISQAAALKAVSGLQTPVEEMRSEYEKRRNYLHGKLTAIKGISCPKPGGAFYLFPNISAYFGNYNGFSINNSVDFSLYLLNNAGVAVVPGSAFGKEGYVRISFAASMENLQGAARKIRESLSVLTNH